MRDRRKKEKVLQVPSGRERWDEEFSTRKGKNKKGTNETSIANRETEKKQAFKDHSKKGTLDIT